MKSNPLRCPKGHATFVVDEHRVESLIVEVLAVDESGVHVTVTEREHDTTIERRDLVCISCGALVASDMRGTSKGDVLALEVS